MVQGRFSTHPGSWCGRCRQGLRAFLGFAVGRWWLTGASAASLAILVLAAWLGLLVASLLAPVLAGEPLTAQFWPDAVPPQMGFYGLALSEVRWLRDPVVISSIIRELDAFRGKPSRAIDNWAWFVHSTRRVSATDFKRITAGQTISETSCGPTA